MEPRRLSRSNVRGDRSERRGVHQISRRIFKSPACNNRSGSRDCRNEAEHARDGGSDAVGAVQILRLAQASHGRGSRRVQNGTLGGVNAPAHTKAAGGNRAEGARAGRQDEVVATVRGILGSTERRGHLRAV